MFCNFTTTTHGKWILAGEHAVLRGKGALVFPVKEKNLILDYQSGEKELRARYDGEHGDTMHVLFWSVLEQGLQLLNSSLNRISGRFQLTSNLPVGVGLGASAALCVAMARWFAAQNFLPTERVADFAKELENLFHGKSSGLDIIGVSSGTGVYFNQGHCEPIAQQWSPQWYLSSCGQIGITSQCIHQVQELWQNDPIGATNIDETMERAVIGCREALANKTSDSLLLLTEAIKLAYDCFCKWGLMSKTLLHHIQLLKDAGATAVKPTGSGGGGFVLSVWKTPPPAHLLDRLIAV